MKYLSILSILFLCLLISCDDSIGDTDPDTTGSSSLRTILPGYWDINLDGSTYDYERITVSDNSVYFMDESYNGNFSSTNFTGTRSYGSVQTKLVINKKSDISISGYKSTTYSGYENRDDFTATKVGTK